MSFSIRKASKKKQKARLFFYGMSGSGKTRNSLEIAKGLSSGKIVVIDSENETSGLYSDLFDFDILPIDAPYSMDNLYNAFKQAEQYVGEGGVVIVDSLTKFWDGVGGALDEVNKITGGQRSKTQDAWGVVTPKISRAVETISSSKTAHVIVTARCKSESIMEEYTDRNGQTKTKSVKVGSAPKFKGEIEYEWDVSLEFSLNMNKDGKDIQIIRNTKPPRISYFRDLQFVIPPNTADGFVQWNPEEVVAQIKFFLDQGVDPALVSYIDRINILLGQYQTLTGNVHTFSTLDLSSLSKDELIQTGKQLKTDVETIPKKEPIPS